MAVTQAEFGAMKQVNGPEIALLRPGGYAAPQHARPGEEPAPGAETFAPQLLRRQMARLESHRVVGIARIEPPAFLQQSPLLGQAPVKSRTRKWHQVSERRQQESMIDGELHGAREVVRRIAVTSEHERPVHRDMKTPQLGDGPLDAAVHRIDRFAHLAEVGRLKALESDEKAAAAASHDQVEQLGIMRNVDAGLAHPTHSQWNQRPQELLQSLDLAGEIVVHQENEFR